MPHFDKSRYFNSQQDITRPLWLQRKFLHQDESLLLSAGSHNRSFNRNFTHTSQALRAPVKRAPDDWPIKKGYVAFGDSFAAGMGTGTTSTGPCRVGSNNFGDLLYTWTNNPLVDYQQMACSGDTTFGLNRQIKEWQSPDIADVATISMGGNDLGFPDLVWYCVITPDHFLKPNNKQKCEVAKTKAKNLMNLSDGNGLQAKLRAAYTQILDKSTRADFHLYVTSYPLFFNADDPDCDKATFYQWSPSYNPDKPDDGSVYLTTDLRNELNGLVQQLNTVIFNAVEDANTWHGGNQTHFVDVNPKFDNKHHWCEEGDFHEPDENRQDTWFFLSGWKDEPIDSAHSSIQKEMDDNEQQIEKNQINHYISAGSIPLPDSSTCNQQLGTDPDPWAQWMCRTAEGIAANPNGTGAQNYKAANNEVANGNVTGQHIPWYIPTRQVKSFHPRSPGMAAYRDAIIEAINAVQMSAMLSEGNCVLNITEKMDCQDVADNLSALVYLYAPDGSKIYIPESGSHQINDNDPFTINSPYGPLKVVGEHTHDYIQFSSGKYSWTSGTTSGPATCHMIGPNWNPGVLHDGLASCHEIPKQSIMREFGCQFPCLKPG